MARGKHPIRPGIMAGCVPDYPTFTLEEVSVMCRQPGCTPSYLSGWHMVKHGVRSKGKTIKLRACRVVGNTVVEHAAVLEFMQKLNPGRSERTRSVSKSNQPVMLRRGEIGRYDLPEQRQVSLQRAGIDLSGKEISELSKTESSGRARRAVHRKGRTGAAL